MRSGRSVTSSWHSAPPVSLPTSVTSSRSSASSASAIRRATPRGERSASGCIARVCEPSGQSGQTQRNSPSSSGDDLAPQRAVDEQAVDEDDRRARAGVADVMVPCGSVSSAMVVLRGSWCGYGQIHTACILLKLYGSQAAAPRPSAPRPPAPRSSPPPATLRRSADTPPWAPRRSSARPGSRAARSTTTSTARSDLFAAVYEQIEARPRRAHRRAVGAAGADPLERSPPAPTRSSTPALDPEVQRIALLDAPAVLGWERWREIGCATAWACRGGADGGDGGGPDPPPAGPPARARAARGARRGGDLRRPRRRPGRGARRGRPVLRG